MREAQIREAFELAGKQAGFRVADASPLRAASRITVPVLLVHGAEDRETSPEHSRRVYAALGGPKTMRLVEKAGHNRVLAMVWPEVDRWIEEQVALMEAEQILMATSSFDDVAVGFAGTTPAAVHAYRSLLGAPDGAARFGAVLGRAGPAGQLYALCGLFFLDPTRFEEGVSRLRGAATRLERMVGCIKTETTVREMLTRDGKAPSMSHAGTADDWRRGPYPQHLDVAGGSVCYRLRFDGHSEPAPSQRK